MDISATIERLHKALEGEHEESADPNRPQERQKALLKLLKGLDRETTLSDQVATSLKEVVQLYDRFSEQERQAFLKAFNAEGGEDRDFDLRPTEVDAAFREREQALNQKIKAWRKGQKKQAREALATQRQLLNRLRALLDKGDIKGGFSEFKKIQSAWREATRLPKAQSRELWANYHALVDRFYDHKSIYVELKELDRKKNLSQKIDLCVSLEKLIDTDNIRAAFEKLHAAHHDFKSIGPVPKPQSEAIWKRFKAASDAIRRKWNQRLKEIRDQYAVHRQQKEKLIEQIGSFGRFDSSRIADWQAQTRALLRLKEQWERVGPVSRSQSAELGKRFWSAYQDFFRKKKAFFKKKEGDRTVNLQQKEALLAQLVALKEQPIDAAAIEQAKQIQQTWNTIGPVPTPRADALTRDFRAAADHVFSQRRQQLEAQHLQAKENTQRKKALCREIEKAAKKAGDSLAPLDDLVKKYVEIGPPTNDEADELEVQFNRAVDTFLKAATGVGKKIKDRKRFEIQLLGLQDDPYRARKIREKRQQIGKKIRRGEHDIFVFQNNLDSFGRSKGAHKLREDLEKKLDEARARIDEMKKQSKLLKSVL